MKLDGYFGNSWAGWKECPKGSVVSGFKVKTNKVKKSYKAFNSMKDCKYNYDCVTSGCLRPWAIKPSKPEVFVNVIEDINLKCRDRSGKEVGYVMNSNLCTH